MKKDVTRRYKYKKKLHIQNTGSLFSLKGLLFLTKKPLRCLLANILPDIQPSFLDALPS